MLRVLITLSISLFLACSSDSPTPTGPSDPVDSPDSAGKAVGTADAPAAPTNLRVEALTDTSAKVAWDAVEGAADYDLNYRTLSGRWTNWPIRGAKRAYTTIHGLEPDTEYRWAVRAENKDGASRWTFAENFTTAITAPPVEPDLPKEEAPESTLPVEQEEEFSIEIVYLDSFTPQQKSWIEDVAARWEIYFSGAPDYTFTQRQNFRVIDLRFSISAGEQIDDLRVYVADSAVDHDFWEGEAGGWASVLKFRPDGNIPLVAAIGLNASQLEDDPISVEWAWKTAFQHELGHAFGIGSSPAWHENITMHTLYDPDSKKMMNQYYYDGSNALREYNQLHPNPHFAGIRVSINNFQEKRAVHWANTFDSSTEEPFLAFDIFVAYFSHTNGGTNMSRVSLGAFEDIGWQVHYDRAMSKLLFNETIGDCWLHEDGYEWLDFVIDCE